MWPSQTSIHFNMSYLGIARSFGLTPGCLRGSGATFFHLSDILIADIQWRGRWSNLKSLEYYIQETASQSVLIALSDESKAKISDLSDASEGLLTLITELLRVEI